MKKSITVSINSEKLSALEMYLEFIELTAAKKPTKKSKNTAPAENENQSEQ